MNAIVYRNTGTPVPTSRNIFSSQKHPLSWLFCLLTPIKNTHLAPFSWHIVCRFWQRMRVADSKQTVVFNRFMRGEQ